MGNHDHVLSLGGEIELKTKRSFRNGDELRNKQDLMEEVAELKEELEEVHNMIRKLQDGKVSWGTMIVFCL